MKYWVGLWLLVVGGALSGQVTVRLNNPQGQPIVGAEVWHLPSSFLGQTNGQGTFVLPSNTQGSLRFVHPEWQGLELAVPRQDTTLTLQAPHDQLQEVVVTSSRQARAIRDLPMQVSVLQPSLLFQASAPTLAEGLNFQPGLRVEINCQTCNYAQIRINGLPGSYTQVLINGLQIYGAMAGLYGLEQFPANALQQVEVIRGSGATLYGAGAMGGTVNILLRNPGDRLPEWGAEWTSPGAGAWDARSWISATVIQRPHASWALTGQVRKRLAYDANNDGFSEIPALEQGLLMAEGLLRLGSGQLKTHLAWLGEERNGGDQLHLAPDERQQSEWRRGALWLGTLDYSLPLSGATLRTYLGATYHPRQHYTGFGGPAGFGYTYNTLINPGAQLSGTQQWKGLHRWVTGAEFQGEWLDDAVPGYGYAIEQTTRQWGFFAHDEWTVRGGHTFTIGARVTAHNFLPTPLLTPNLGWKWNAGPIMTYRLAWGTGFRPPQLFGPDLHMAFAGGGVSRITQDPTLQKELSQSVTASADATLRGETSTFTANATAFYTALIQPFVIEERGTDSLGNQILVRTNGAPAQVAGITMGINWMHSKGYAVEASLTGQTATFEAPQTWSSSAPAERMMLRTPQWYGYLSASAPLGKFTLATTAALTGPMLVPHFAGAPGVPHDVLRTTPWMLDAGVKLSREWMLSKRWGLETWVAVINVFNQFQADFDEGVNRDSNFIYGPARPRSLNIGLRLDLHP